MAIKLTYIGKQEFPGFEPLRLWNVETPSHPSYRSTLSLYGLLDAKIVSPGQVKIDIRLVSCR